MSTANGVLTPLKVSEEPQSLSGTKRKRSESNPPTADVHLGQKEQPGSVGRPTISAAALQDTVQVLKCHDYGSAILDFPLQEAKKQSSSDQPTAKRARLIDGARDDTIAARTSAGRYSTVEDLEKDVLEVCAACIAAAKTGEQDDTVQTKRLSLEAASVIQRVMSFEFLARKVFAQAKQDTKRNGKGVSHAIADTTTSVEIQNGIKAEPGSPKLVRPAGGRTVLSLFGNAPTPRQLFSSLQQGSDVHGQPEIPLEELGLPSMLTASSLLPLRTEQDLATSGLSFRDVFAPAASLAQLRPPKTTKSSSGRSASISFVAGDALTKANREGGYPTQPLPVGRWLVYGNEKEPIKKKQRDRSSSIVDLTKSVEEDVGTDAPNEEALFKAAYSSFAPSFDDSKAIISKDDRDMVWWQKGGERRYDGHFPADTTGEDVENVDGALNGVSTRDEASQFEDAIANFDESAMNADTAALIELPEDMSPQELMEKISELLEVLASHQRLRNSYISPPSRTPASPNPLAMLGTPSELSTEEADVYRSLRSRLAELVARLPPYMVAKLEGEQLEDLRVNKRISIEERSYKGILEEDQLTRMARSAAAAAATTKASASSSQGIGGQYGRSPSVSQAGARPAQTPSFYGSNQTQSTYGRSTGQTFNTPANAARQAFSQLGSYTAPANRTAPQYGQPASSQFYQRPSFGQPYGRGSPQPQTQNYGANTGLYQNRAQNATAFSQNTAQNSPYMRNASPAKPVSSYNTSIYPQSRPANPPTNSVLTPMSYGQQQQQQQQQQQATNSPAATAQAAASMTSEQQRMVLERQRAQLAAQTQARNAAQVGMRPSSATPQPVQAVQQGGGTV